MVKANNIQDFNKRYVNDANIHKIFKLDHFDQTINSDWICPWTSPYVLDFDLDCFTNNDENIVGAWTEEEFTERYVKNEKVYQIIMNLIYGASIITICREPEFCGGMGQSNNILTYLDKYFFNGALEAEG